MEYQRRVTLQMTDATGVIHFTSLFKFSVEAFEQFLFDHDFSVQKMIKELPYLFPIVHAEADYFAPICVDDELLIDLSLKSVSEKAFHIEAKIKKEGKCVGKTTLIHAVLDRESKEAIAIPQTLAALLSKV